jgi:hypothetical protein
MVKMSRVCSSVLQVRSLDWYMALTQLKTHAEESKSAQTAIGFGLGS